MTLSRSTPLRSDPSHTFPEKGAVRTCEDCGAVWRTRYYDDPPPWPCTGLKRGSGLKRTPLSPVSDRREEKRAHQRDSAFRGWVRRQPCVVCGARPSDAAHVSSWGSGAGDWIAKNGAVSETSADKFQKVANLVSLCRAHHSEQHAVGIETFERRHDVDLEAKAAEMGERFRAHQQQEGTDGASG